ncbi:MAG: phage holin family protein [Congregibacter sp.]
MRNEKVHEAVENRAREDSRSPVDLVGTALDRVNSLLRNEVDLARAEVNDNVEKAGVAISVLVAAVVFALTALNVLIGALIAGLAELGMDEGLAALLVGGALAALAFVLSKKGLDDLRLSSLAPTRTAENVKRDANAVKEGLK